MKIKSLKSTLLFTLLICLVHSCIPVRSLKPFINEKGVILTKEGYIATKKNPYKVKIGDEIRIKILVNDPNLGKYFGNEFSENKATNNLQGTENFKGRVVGEDGYIQIPKIGSIYVKNKTFKEISADIKLKLKMLYKGDVELKVGLVSYTFYITGEVGHSKQYNSYRRLNLIEALTMSGNMPLTANRSKIRIFKKEDNGYRLVKLDLNKMSTMNLSEFYIDNNDIIQVDPINTKTLGIGTSALKTILTITSFITSMVTFLIFIKRL